MQRAIPFMLNEVKIKTCTHTHIGRNVFCMLFYQIKTNKMYQRNKTIEQTNEQANYRGKQQQQQYIKFVQIGFWCKNIPKHSTLFFSLFLQFPIFVMHAFSIVVVAAAAAVCYIYIYLQTKTMRERKKRERFKIAG